MLDLLCQLLDLREQLRFTLIRALKISVTPYKGYPELLYIVSSEHIAGLEMLRRTRLHIYRSVFGSDFIGRPILSVHVDGKRLTRQLTPLRHLNPLKAMPGVLVCFKENAVIEKRGIGIDLTIFKVPGIRVKFQISSPFLFPFLVQINNCVEPAMVSGRPAQVKINVGIHSLPRKVIMGASTMIFRIIQQVLNPGNALHNLGEFRRCNVVVYEPIGWAD